MPCGGGADQLGQKGGESALVAAMISFVVCIVLAPPLQPVVFTPALIRKDHPFSLHFKAHGRTKNPFPHVKLNTWYISALCAILAPQLGVGLGISAS